MARIEEKSKPKLASVIWTWVGIIPLFGVTIIFLVMMASLINSLFGKGVSL